MINRCTREEGKKITKMCCPRHLLTTKEKRVSLQWWNAQILTPRNQGQETNQYREPLVQCTEKDTTPFLWYSCQKCAAPFHSQGHWINPRFGQKYLTNHLINTLQNVKVMKDKKTLKNHYRTISPYFSKEKLLTCHVVSLSWMRSRNWKTLVEKWVKFKWGLELN